MAKNQLSSLSVFFPAFNEAPNLPELIMQADQVISRVAKNYELIVVDDGSTDNTLILIKKLQHKYPRLRVVVHQKNLGYGAALKTGIGAAQYDWIFFTDADLQFDINDIQRLLPFTQNYQVIIGWRKKRAEGMKRTLNTRLFKLHIDLLYRLHVKDIDCAFKLMKRELVQSIHLQSDGAFTTAELLYKLKKCHVTFKEIPVAHYPRLKGEPTGANLKVILKAVWESLTLYLSIKLAPTK